jgi:hypothetical protein
MSVVKPLLPLAPIRLVAALPCGKTCSVDGATALYCWPRAYVWPPFDGQFLLRKFEKLNAVPLPSVRYPKSTG